MAELAQRLCLDLADTLTRDVEDLAHFLKRSGSAVLETEAELQHLFLSGRQRGEHLAELLAQKRIGRRLRGRGRGIVLDEVA